ncbi:hypothetical protein IFM89_009703 [Coptis chinensis]|uniref:USP domain-containing protein n=1 Tax=Coptis chinensis TaxID=261450 RepID=A0A835LZ48_9MAGN|nr:hypothetical protein IFM89_009703 [Coptis chinensis]
MRQEAPTSNFRRSKYNSGKSSHSENSDSKDKDQKHINLQRETNFICKETNQCQEQAGGIHLYQCDDEIEVDIDVVDVETLWELDRFVTYYKKSLSKKKKVVHQSEGEVGHYVQEVGGKFGKLNKVVLFLEILNLAPYMSGTSDKSPIYRLYAVVVHLDTMNAAFSRHYVCYIRNFKGKWLKIDDSIEIDVELQHEW